VIGIFIGIPGSRVVASSGICGLAARIPVMVVLKCAADHYGGPEWIALGGKRGPGKSHAAMAQAALDDCQRVPGLKFLFLRKVMKTAAESLEDLVRRLCLYAAHVQTANEIKFANDSRILLGGYKDARDIDKYLGIEYDGILIEECTQLLESKKDAIRGSLRSSKTDWRPRIYLTTNADGPGLMWFKKMLVLPQREGNETNTRFFDVTGINNPYIGREYNDWLDTLTGPLRKA
jgi:phage terminase large subunit